MHTFEFVISSKVEKSNTYIYYMNSESVLSFFKEITAIPRESGHEEHIIAYLQDFAARNNFECKTDKAGNVLITKPAAPGYENVPTIVLQSHSDMVCEKNEGVEHDFAKDPIKYIIKDGWMIAPDTTLGADCGIGVAAQMAMLVTDIPCGKIECLFTTAEETGLDGAMALQPGFFEGKVLLNLDSEDEGIFTVSCAGGARGTIHLPLERRVVYGPCVKLTVEGLQGGHSGVEIHEGHTNAIKAMGRSDIFLKLEIIKKAYGMAILLLLSFCRREESCSVPSKSARTRYRRRDTPHRYRWAC